MKILRKYGFYALFISCILLVSKSTFAQVKVYEGTEIIPTYKMGNDELSPMFYNGKAVQGAQGKVYPYPLQTNLGNELVNVEYKMVYLENKYIKLKVLPAFGGKLFSAIDKTNGHELFHTNSVIKADLIGTLGAWISGGIEWCFPDHHRTTTMLPSDYRMVKNDDGSATIWVGETEKSRGLRGIVRITLRPERSYIEVVYRISNPNTTTKTFLFWANVAVTANKDFRTFWPPSQEIAVFHNNSSFTEWPVSHEIYQGTDYTKGVDLTWWKNHPNPVSFFMWQAKGNFVGGYDYSKSAGTIHVGDPIKNHTSKLWQFGPGLQGQNARRKLTDDGKAYVELMTGTFSNNQPDYSWIIPHSVKDAKNYWYPIRDLEIVKSATRDAAVTLQMRDEKTVFYGFNTTTSFKSAQLTLKYGEKVLVEKKINIDPATPFTATYNTKEPIDKYKLTVELKDNKGHKLVSYTPYKPQHPKLPKPQERVKKPDELGSVEDLYLTGRFVEQFRRAGIDPDDYYLAALKKSPDDYRVNIALGIRRVGQTRYKEALSYFQTAARKLHIKYYQPKEGELYYHMGLAQKELGHIDEAYRNFGRATWYYKWVASGNYELAKLDCKKGDYNKALEHIKEAYATDMKDGRINVLYSAILRRLGKTEKAIELMNNLLAYDPLDFAALYEKGILQGDPSLLQWHKNMQDVENDYLECATQYMDAGFLQDALSLLLEIKDAKNPLTFYYLSWLEAHMGNHVKAMEMHKLAKNASLDYVFPYRHETEKILNDAITSDSSDATAYYLLGNLLYDSRPGEAMAAWDKANLISPSPMVCRNLAFGTFYHQKDPAKAITYMTKAISLDNSHPHWYDELSQYYDESNLDFKNILAIFKKNLDIIKKDVAAPKTYIKLLNLNGEYDKAIKFLTDHHFRTWEGGRETYWYYVDAHTLKALDQMDNKKYDLAVAQLKKALLYPENIEVGKPTNDERNAMIYYFMGNAYDKMGNEKQAIEQYQKSASSVNGYRMMDLLYFQGKSFKNLGQADKAKQLFQELIDRGKALREEDASDVSIAVKQATFSNKKAISQAYYLEALGNLGLNNNDKAHKLFEFSIKAYKNNLWPRIMRKY